MSKIKYSDNDKRIQLALRFYPVGYVDTVKVHIANKIGISHFT
ncbi:hypothetical protein [Shewanella denitrificans]|nr:hypothetical protein [Shewanella denitrificans]